MKKFYSLVLMAAALLIGTTVWAGDLTVTFHGPTATSGSTQDFDDLQAAIDAIAPGDSATIVLNQTIMLDNGILIPHLTKNDTLNGVRILNRAAQRICIDLNGKNIQTKTTCNHCCIALMKGVLRLTGTGNVERANVGKGNTNYKRGAILVSGIDGDRNDASNDRSKQTWSRLYVDKDVTVKSTATDTYAIGIQDLGNVAPEWNGFEKKFADYSTYYASDGPMWAGPNQTAQYSAFGVEIFIEGTLYGHTRGINVLGNLNQAPKYVEGADKRKYATYPYYDHRYPYVYIGSNADVSCTSNGIKENGNGGIYVGGWAIIDIHGEVYGQTGVFMKSGDVKLIDGNVYSTADGAAGNSGNYHGDVSGSGIFIASTNTSSGYVGETGVLITGDSHVAGAGGSAIVDVLATGADGSKVTHVEITGGTIEGGDEGAINLTTGTENQTAVTGGNVEGTVTVEGNTVNVSTLVPNTDSYHTTTVKDENDNIIVVVSQGAAPVVANLVSTATGSIKWQNTSVKKDTIKSDLTLTELEISEAYDQTLVINEGKKLTVGRVVLGANAQIIVEAGAKLIVTGEQGVVAPSVDNIVLRTQEGKPAIFLFNPAVTSNRNPKATVEFISKACYRYPAQKNIYQRFGLPMKKDGLESIEGAGDPETRFYKYDYDQDKWVGLGYINPSAGYVSELLDIATMNDPFEYYQMLNFDATTPAGVVYTMKGKLLGNSEPVMDIFGNSWKGFANSYMGTMKLSELLKLIPNTVDKAIYTYNVKAAYATWEPVTNLNAADQIVNPMQPFLIRNRYDAANVTLDYEETVYKPTLGLAPKSAPRREVNDITMAKITIANENSADYVIVAESAEFTPAFDNGYDASKFMNDEANLYVMAEENMSVFATDNLENTKLGVSSVLGGSYTMSFSNVNGEEFVLVDNLTGNRTLIAEGNTYEFEMVANTTNDYRFEIVPVAKMPTAIDNTEAVKSVKGIYTITGQYVGENFEVLPAGVYVVDGVKIVK